MDYLFSVNRLVTTAGLLVAATALLCASAQPGTAAGKQRPAGISIMPAAGADRLAHLKTASNDEAATPKLKADPAAYALLEDAHNHRQTFAPGFAGMTARIAFDDNGIVHTGAIRSDAQDNVIVDVAGLNASNKDWLEDQLENLIGHRRSGSFAQGEGQYPITFGPADHSPLGTQVVLHDPLQSSYRIRDHQLIDVTRTMGGMRFSITVLESEKTPSGKYLPHQFVVTYFNPDTGAIDHVDDYTDTFAWLAGNWLPASRRVITARNGGFTTRIITLSDLRAISR